MSVLDNITLVQCADLKSHLHVLLFHRELPLLSQTSQGKHEGTMMAYIRVIRKSHLLHVHFSCCMYAYFF